MATPPPQPYKTGLCDCCADCGVCCWGYWCPCWLFGDTSEKLDRAAGDPNAGCCTYRKLDRSHPDSSTPSLTRSLAYRAPTLVYQAVLVCVSIFPTSFASRALSAAASARSCANSSISKGRVREGLSRRTCVLALFWSPISHPFVHAPDCPACCAYTCCGGCAACQDAREFRLREAEIVNNAYAVQQAQQAAPVQAEIEK